MTKNKYRDKSDFEINKAVAVALGYKVRPSEESVLAYIEIGYKTFDPSNNPADAKTNNIENKISLTLRDTDHICVADTTRSLESSVNENP